MSKNLAKGWPRPPLQNQFANPEDWLIRDKEGSFIDNDTEDKLRNGMGVKDGPYVKIIQVYLYYYAILYYSLFITL